MTEPRPGVVLLRAAEAELAEATDWYEDREDMAEHVLTFDNDAATRTPKSRSRGVRRANPSVNSTP
jgi:hypothetical protein